MRLYYSYFGSKYYRLYNLIPKQMFKYLRFVGDLLHYIHKNYTTTASQIQWVKERFFPPLHIPSLLMTMKQKLLS